jgi:WD40 repeat protein
MNTLRLNQALFRSLAYFFVLFVPLWCTFRSTASAGEPTYWEDIRPVLRKNCTACHSKKNLHEPEVSGGLALDSYEAVVKGTKKPVIHPGKSGESLLMKLLLINDSEKRMPLAAAPLPPESITLIRRWIDTGAKEGKKPDEGPVTVASTTIRRTRKLAITLPTTAVPPKGLLGPGTPAKLELSLPVGPLSPVVAVAFSPDGKLLATGSYRQVTVWDLTSARPVKTLTNVLGAVNDLRFRPDGRILAVAGGQPSAKGDLRLYNVADWKLAATLGGHEDVVFCVAFHPDGKHLASASFDKTVRIWDLASHKPERILTGHSDFVYSVTYSPDGQWLVSASKDRSVKLVDASTGKSRFTFSGMDQDVLALAVSPDGKNVVSSGFDSALYWWDSQTGQRVRLQSGHGIAVHEMCFSRDGKILASAGADKTVRVWNGQTGALLRTLPVGSIAYAVALNPAGTLLASGSFDGLVRLWDPATGRQLLTLLAVPAEGDFDWLAVTPEGYAATNSKMATLGQWRMAGQAVSAEPVWKTLQQPTAVVRALRGEPLTQPVFPK